MAGENPQKRQKAVTKKEKMTARSWKPEVMR
jgi:hypothetical protein